MATERPVHRTDVQSIFTNTKQLPVRTLRAEKFYLDNTLSLLTQQRAGLWRKKFKHKILFLIIIGYNCFCI